MNLEEINSHSIEYWEQIATKGNRPFDVGFNSILADWKADQEKLIAEKAEARKEGIEALQNDLKKWPAAGVVWISVDALDKAAERLKEQG